MFDTFIPEKEEFFDEESEVDILDQARKYLKENPTFILERIYISQFDGDLDKIEIEKVLEDSPFNLFELMAGLITMEVESSHLSHIGYNPVWEVLGVRFKNGQGEFRYKNITPAIWQDFIQAESQGSYFSRVIKPNKEDFPYIQIKSQLYTLS